jgi:ABC-2 type transport system ATP-binding protein
MGQKLQFVITVLHEPDLIILDEPFSGLDPINANLIKDEIYRLAQNGTTIIFSTHRMEQVEEICDHIALINKGKKILDGTVTAVKQNFKENLFSVQLENTPSNISSNTFNLIHSHKQELIVKINEGYKANDVLNHFIRAGENIVSFREILPSLNDIFIKLVEGTPTARQFETISV